VRGEVKMKYVNIMDAKEQFADLVTQLDTHRQDKIVLTYNEKPVIEMTRAPKKICGKRIGVAKGKFKVPAEFDDWDKEVLEMFGA